MASTNWTPPEQLQLTFGVEFEIAVASLEPDQALPDPSEKRTLYFTPIKEDEDWEDPGAITTWRTVARYMAKSLTYRGYATTIEADNNYTTWDITTDPSIHPPGEAEEGNDTAYKWHPIEIRSPALSWSDAALRAVEDMCAIITSKYCVNTNESTGLHVHVGFGHKGFE